MPVDAEQRRTIEDFVRQQPRNIQEIADKLNKSWKTADRYVKEVAEKEGNIKVRKFREGSRGALKVVYWSGRSQVFSSGFKESLFKKIENNSGFTPFDIYQCVEEDKREAFVEAQDPEVLEIKHNVETLLRQAENEVLIFSRNLSWAELKQKNGKPFTEIFQKLAEEGVEIKFIARIDLSSLENTEELLKINREVGREAVTIRHSNQPVRGFTVDKKLAHLSEARKLEEEYVNKKTDKTRYVFYTIRQEEWINWLQNSFRTLYRNALNAENRIEDLKTIKNLRNTDK